MSTIPIPIHYRLLTPPRHADGPIRRILTASIELTVADRTGQFVVVPACRLDSGCSTTMMSATLARLLGIPFSMGEPYETSSLTANGVLKATVYHGELKVRFAADPTLSYRLFCLFSESHSPTTPLLLALHDLLEVFRFTFDGTSTLAAPMGSIHLDTYS